MNAESQIYCCYCSENLPDKCNYCMAKHDIRELLDFPPQDEGEDMIDRIFKQYSIAPKARLEIIFDLETGSGGWL